MSAVYHCMSRIVGKQSLLGYLEREVLRKQIWKLADFCGIEVLTYAVLGNHFHVLIRVPEKVEIDDNELVRRIEVLYGEERARVVEAGLTGGAAQSIREGYIKRMGDVSEYMKELKQRFSIWYNRTHNRVGTLWAERFKSVLVEPSGSALRTVAAYIDLNAVRARFCRDPKDYRFCGYGEACAGGRMAQMGLSSVMGEKGWRRAGWEYRLILFGKGYYVKMEGKGAVSWEDWQQVRDACGKLPLGDALRCRVRYFTEGTILGSREFVEEQFAKHRSAFGVKRKSGARKLRGAEWEDLYSARDLRKDVFG